ncbi:MAG: Asp/Glu/Hydantoin racemase [Syntrophorhabdus sp. PtaU1.Bin058]|nr:MAG: Asp/Glu/Hydantoin racemase [Syntrophorhabdus sp. PtaU1.Bin058]
MNNIVMVLPFVESAEVVTWTRECYRHITGVDFVGLEEGKDPLFTSADVEMNVPAMLNRLMLAEKQGYKAGIMGCFGDPGLFAAHQVVAFPVVGPGQSSLLTASMLGERSMIISPCRNHAYATEKLVQSYGYSNRVASIRWMNKIGVEACITRSEEGVRDTADICLKEIAEKDIHVVIFGCIGLNWMADDLHRIIAGAGYDCPVVEPGLTSIAHAKMLLDLKLNQSREMHKL